MPMTKAGSVLRVEGDTTGDGGKAGMQSFSLATTAEKAQTVVEAAEEAAAAVEEHTVSADQVRTSCVCVCVCVYLLHPSRTGTGTNPLHPPSTSLTTSTSASCIP